VIVRAAGGVPWRAGPRGAIEIALVHRPRYGDWTLPKGKLEPAEHPLAAAVREVFEETGLDCVPQVRLPTINYLTGVPGVEKSVDFWSMRVTTDHGREPDHEVTEVRWVDLGEAPGMLTYAHDRGVVVAFAELPRISTELTLVRHAHAGSRRGWPGPDGERPLSPRGVREAAALAGLLLLCAPERVISASPLRCRETVAPLAAALGVPVKVDPAFDEDPPRGVPGALAAVQALARDGVPTTICSQGKLIPPLLSALRPGNATAIEEFGTPKGSGWLLAFAGTEVVSADRLTPGSPAPGPAQLR
jgi:8-oxo-dGTP diphosphatase